MASDHQLVVPTPSEADAQRQRRQRQPPDLDSSVLSWYQRLLPTPRPSSHHHQPERDQDSTITRDRQPGPAGGEVDGSIGSPPPPPAPNISQLTDPCSDNNASLLAVVGIKSAVGNFDRRQAVRETWAQAELGPLSGRVCLLFITGRAGTGLPRGAGAALALEAAVYGDLFGVGPGTGHKEGGVEEATVENKNPPGKALRNYPLGEKMLGTNPLMEEAVGNHPPGGGLSGNAPLREEVGGVWDGYENLIDKTVGFMETAMDHMPHYEYLMMMDDDVYLRLDLLGDWLHKRVPQADERGFYAGQVGTYP